MVDTPKLTDRNIEQAEHLSTVLHSLFKLDKQNTIDRVAANLKASQKAIKEMDAILKKKNNG